MSFSAWILWHSKWLTIICAKPALFWINLGTWKARLRLTTNASWKRVSTSVKYTFKLLSQRPKLNVIFAIDNGCWKIHTELERDVNPDPCDIGAVLQWLSYKDHSIDKRKVHKSRYLMNKTTIMSARFAAVLSVFFSLVHCVNLFSTQNNESNCQIFGNSVFTHISPWTCPE